MCLRASTKMDSRRNPVDQHRHHFDSILLSGLNLSFCFSGHPFLRGAGGIGVNVM